MSSVEKSVPNTKNVTTSEDYEFFRAECARWIVLFGLLEYVITYQHGGCSDNNSFAEAWVNIKGRNSRIVLNDDWGDEPVTKAQLSQSAFHEVCEIMVSELEDLACNRFVNEYEIRRAAHAIIRRLENAVWKKEVAND